MGPVKMNKPTGEKKFKGGHKDGIGKVQQKKIKVPFAATANGLKSPSKKRKLSVSNEENQKGNQDIGEAGLKVVTNESGPVSVANSKKQVGKKMKLNMPLNEAAEGKLTRSADGSANVDTSNTEEQGKKKRRKGKKQTLLTNDSKSPAGSPVKPTANLELDKSTKEKSKLVPKNIVAKPTVPPNAGGLSVKQRKNIKKPFEKTDSPNTQVMKGPFSPKKKVVPNPAKQQQSPQNTETTSEISAASPKKNKKKTFQQKQAISGVITTPEIANAKKGNQEQNGKTLQKKNVNAIESEPLKGKALKRRIATTVTIISRLQQQKRIITGRLFKTKDPQKAIRDEEKFKKINLKLARFQDELETLNSAKINKSSGKFDISPAKTKASKKKFSASSVGKAAAIKSNKAGPVAKFVGLPADKVTQKKKKPNQLPLKDFLQSQLKSSRFRWLNENLYSSSSEIAQEFFKEDPESFKAYHQGYAEQVAKWPVNPLDTIIKSLKSLPKETVVADLGCGEAKLAASLPHLTVHSLDFVALKPEVTACDMAHCPLLRSSVDVVVFCLSLMGTNVSDFLLEANRILKTGGTMEIAEVQSRFDDIDDFIQDVEKYGFNFKKKSMADMFFFLTFSKGKDVNKSERLPYFDLKPCLYKKR